MLEYELYNKEDYVVVTCINLSEGRYIRCAYLKRVMNCQVP